MNGNRIEKLVKESLDDNPYNLHYSEQFKYEDINYEYDKEKYDNFKYDTESDYYKLYYTILNTIKQVLNHQLYIFQERRNKQLYQNVIFTKKDIKKILLGDGERIVGLIDDPSFWEYIEYQHEVPIRPINEGYAIQESIKGMLKSRLQQALSNLIEIDEVKFSKYDVYHVFLYLITSGEIFTNLTKYIPD